MAGLAVGFAGNLYPSATSPENASDYRGIMMVYPLGQRFRNHLYEEEIFDPEAKVEFFDGIGTQLPFWPDRRHGSYTLNNGPFLQELLLSTIFQMLTSRSQIAGFDRCCRNLRERGLKPRAIL